MCRTHLTPTPLTASTMVFRARRIERARRHDVLAAGRRRIEIIDHHDHAVMLVVDGIGDAGGQPVVPDAVWLEENPDVVTYIDKLDRKLEGFRGQYDRLSERCHPNSLGHNLMFSKLDRSDGTVEYV